MNESKCIRHYYAYLYLVCLILLLFFAQYVEATDFYTLSYTAVMLAIYPILYLLPTVVLTRFFRPFILPKRLDNPSSVRLNLYRALVISLSSIATLFVFFDYQLYALYGYHINSFVINLITTPGGIASLGATQSTKMTFSLMAVGLLGMNVFAYFLIYRLIVNNGRMLFSKRFLTRIMICFFVVLPAEEVSHGLASFMNIHPILQACSTIPLHLHLTFRCLAEDMGFQKPPEQTTMIKSGKVKYPLEPIKFTKVENPYNIVCLVSESLRWDMLDPNIMPNLWQFSSDQAIRFNQHYSGGNRTRMGLFSLFYGLYPNYWYSFEQQKIGPVLMDAMLFQNYQMTVNTSQSFTYPELYNTLFVNVPLEYTHELKDESIPAWKRDEINISDILQFIDKREDGRPFFAFMFFEATHAPYTFSEKDVIKSDYLEDMNYAKLDLIYGIDQIKNRYINASYSVDKQVGRLLDYLRDENLLDNTIVLFTGDHGEEFMEKGNWGHGHNAVFCAPQVHVPLVLWIPGRNHKKVDTPTSHADIPGTLAPFLGIESKLEIYSQGSTLFDRQKDFQVFGNYSYLGYMDKKYKIAFPFKDYPYFHYQVSGVDDNLINKQEKKQVLLDYKNVLAQFEKDAEKFINE